MEDNQFEQKIGQEMAGFKLKPSDAVWQNVDAQLKEDRKRRRWIIIFLLTGLMLGGSATVYFTTNNSTSLNDADIVVNKTTESVTQQQTITTHNSPKEQPVITKKNESNTKRNSTESGTVPVIKVQQTSVQNQRTVRVATKSKHSSSKKQLFKQQDTNDNVIVDNEKNTQPVAVVTEIKTDVSVIDTTSTVKVNSKDVMHLVVAEKDSAVAKVDSAEVNAGITKQVDTTVIKKKGQWGLQLNAGIAQIRDNVFPGAKSFTADASPLFGNNGGTGGPTRITVNQFSIKSSLQFGAGILVRKPVKKKHFFVTGLQYQYSSYKVDQIQRVDSFYQSTNSFATLMQATSKAVFKTHSIAVPLDFEWKIAATGKGMFRLSTGLQQWFTFASFKQGDTLSSFRYDVTTSGAPASGNATAKATRWQPILQLAPVYEWGTKKQTSQLGLYFNYGLRPVYKTTTSDYWWQTGVRYRFYFTK